MQTFCSPKKHCICTLNFCVSPQQTCSQKCNASQRNVTLARKSFEFPQQIMHLHPRFVFLHKTLAFPQETFHLYARVLRFPTRNFVLAFKHFVLSQKTCYKNVAFPWETTVYVCWQKLYIYPRNTFFSVKCPDINEKHTHTRAAGLLSSSISSVTLNYSLFAKLH